jgi:hypothetical protein
VVVLVIITAWYARSAKRQATAAESQAQAATRQAQVAERNLALLEAQIQSRAGAALATMQASIAELRKTALHWIEQMRQWGVLTAPTGSDLLPIEWTVSLENARAISPALHHELLALQGLTRETMLLIDRFAAKDATYRRENEATRIRECLLAVVEACTKISAKLEGIGPAGPADN